MRIKRTKKGMSAFVAYHLDKTKITHAQLKRKFTDVYGLTARKKYFEKLLTKHIG